MGRLLASLKRRYLVLRSLLRPRQTDFGVPDIAAEVVKDGREIVARGVTDTEPAACEQANETARKMELIT